jgi:hypothetical protein
MTSVAQATTPSGRTNTPMLAILLAGGVDFTIALMIGGPATAAPPPRD